MKMLMSVLMMVFAFTAFATDTQTFVYDGSQDSVELRLSSEKTHTEYRYEQRPSICYRTVVHYRTVCQNTPQGRFCQTVPYYQQIPYSCMQTISIPYEVKDYDVEATVSLSVASLPEFASRETFRATLRGDTLVVTAEGSKKYLILETAKNVRSQMTGSVKYIQATHAVELVEAAPVVNALSITNISLQKNILNFKMGPVARPELIGFSLEVLKNPVVGGSTELFSRELSADEVSLAAQGSGTSATVDIQALGVKMGSGRHTLTARAFFKRAGKVLNASQFQALEAGRTLIYKNR